MGFLDIFDPAFESIKKLLNFNQDSFYKEKNSSRSNPEDGENGTYNESIGDSFGYVDDGESGSGFDLDAFVREKLSLDPTNLEVQFELSKTLVPKKIIKRSPRKVWRPEGRVVIASPQP